MKKEKIVCVEWDDATYNGGYYDTKTPEEFDLVKTRTVGHLVSKTSKQVVVSQDRFYYKGKPDSDRHLTTIPRKMITGIVYFKVER